MSIDSRQTNSAIVHLSSKHFISKEVVTEYSAISIRKVETVSSSHIYQVSKHSMHSIVLFSNIIKVLCILIYSIRSKHILKQLEWIEIRMLPSWGIIKHSYIWIVHLIVSYKEKSRNENGLLSIFGLCWSLFRKRREVGFYFRNKLFMINISNTDYSHIITIVISWVKFF